MDENANDSTRKPIEGKPNPPEITDSNSGILDHSLEEVLVLNQHQNDGIPQKVYLPTEDLGERTPEEPSEAAEPVEIRPTAPLQADFLDQIRMLVDAEEENFEEESDFSATLPILTSEHDISEEFDKMEDPEILPPTAILPAPPSPKPLSMPRLFRLQVGQKLADRFFLERPLGFGSLGQSWKGFDRLENTAITLKLIPLELQEKPEILEEIHELFRVVASLNAQNHLKPSHWEEDLEHGIVLVAPYLDGLPLDEYYDLFIQQYRFFPRANAIRVLWPTAKVLDEAHRKGILHRGLKPENILISKKSGVRISDFAIPAFVRDRLLECCDIFQESSHLLPYTAPEVLENEKNSTKSDQYSLGAIAYGLLSGRCPFVPKSEVFRGNASDFSLPGSRREPSDDQPLLLSSISDPEQDIKDAILEGRFHPIPGQPQHVNDALEKALSRDPRERFPDCKTFVRTLMDSLLAKELYETKQYHQKHFASRWGWIALLLGVPKNPSVDQLLGDTQRESFWPFEENFPGAITRESTSLGGEHADFPATAENPESADLAANENPVDSSISQWWNMVRSEPFSFTRRLNEVIPRTIQGPLAGGIVATSVVLATAATLLFWNPGPSENGSETAEQGAGIESTAESEKPLDLALSSDFFPGPVSENGDSDSVLPDSFPEDSDQENTALNPGSEDFSETLSVEIAAPDFPLPKDPPLISAGTDSSRETVPVIPPETAIIDHEEEITELSPVPRRESQAAAPSSRKTVQSHAKTNGNTLQQRAEAGDVEAQIELGTRFQKGIGGFERDESRSVDWFRRAAAEHDANAMFQLARAYELGIGVEPDEQRAFAWYQKAQEQQHAQATYRTALFYEQGRGGVLKNESESVRLYRKAAQLGDSAAARYLADKNL